ncbi:MAG: hypothetical protein ACEPO8_11980 [Rhodothermaceae bacterium]
MYRALFYKEWLKIKQAFLFVTLLGLGVIVYLYFDIEQTNTFNDSNAFWNVISGKGYIYYDLFRYIPLVAGLALALAQFVPEIINKKLKLTLHLPLKENKILLVMQSFTLGLLTLLSLVWLLLMIIISSIYFPAEIVNSMILTSLPWFLAGLITYTSVSALVLEPVWGRRIVHGIVGLAILWLLTSGVRYSAFSGILPLVSIAVLFSFSFILWSGRRFKMGVSKND